MTAKGKQGGIVEKAVMHKFPLPNADCCILQFIINSSIQKFIQISTGVTACRSHRVAPQARKNHSKQLTMKKALLHILHSMHVGRPAIWRLHTPARR